MPYDKTSSVLAFALGLVIFVPAASAQVKIGLSVPVTGP